MNNKVLGVLFLDFIFQIMGNRHGIIPDWNPYPELTAVRVYKIEEYDFFFFNLFHNYKLNFDILI